MKKRKQILIYSVLFVLVFAGAFCGLIMNGKSFVWQGDGFRQYYPALQYLGKYYRTLLSGILHLDFSLPMMDYAVGQGEDVITTFCNYGLGDPFSLFAIFFAGKSSMEVLYAILIALRLYASGIAFLCFAGEKKWNSFYALFGAFLYVFCGFSLWSIKDPFFLNGMIYLPIILLGMERIWKYRKPMILIIGTCLCALSGYYFFYMIVMAAVLYFIFHIVKEKNHNLKVMGKQFLDLFLPALSGLFMSCVLLVPSLFGFLSSSRGTAKVSFSSLLLYEGEYYEQLFTQFLAVTPKEDASAVWYFSMGTLVFVAVFLLFVGKKKELKWWKAGLVLMAVAVCSPGIGYFMNGMGYITNRFMFISSFFLACLTVKMMPEILHFPSFGEKWLWLCGGIYCILTFILAGKDSVPQNISMMLFLFGTCICLTISMEERKRKRILLLLLLGNLIANGNMMYQPFGANIQKTYLEAGTVQKQYDNKPVREASEAADSEKMERVDMMTDHGLNPNRAVTMKASSHSYLGCSVYYSVVSSGFSQWMLALENSSGLMYGHRLIGMDGRSVLDQLAAVKYVVCEEPSMVPYGYEKRSKTLYENPNPVSIGYVYHAYIKESTAGKEDALDLQNELLSAVMVEDESPLQKKAEQSGMQELVERADKSSLAFTISERNSFIWKNGKLKIKKKNGTFSTEIIMRPGYEYYLRFQGLQLLESEKNTRWVNVTMDDLVREFVISDETYDFHLDRENYLVTLGSVAQRETKELHVRINGPARYKLENIEIVEVKMDQYEEKVQNLMQDSMTQIKKENNRLSGIISTREDGILCLAVPYRAGYRLYVNGVETEIEKVNKMYVGAYLKKGENQRVELVYETPGLKLGVILTVIGFVFAIFLVIINKKSLCK